MTLKTITIAAQLHHAQGRIERLERQLKIARMLTSQSNEDYSDMKNSIPPITDPLGRHWHQPATASILIDDKHAVMANSTFEALSEYSGTMPSGVYPGKMWRRHDGLFDDRCPPADRRWLLCWFGGHADATKCSINSRLILVAV